MTKVQEGKLRRLYDNCLANADGSEGFWHKTMDAFTRFCDDAHDQEVNELAVDLFMDLQRRYLNGRL